MKRLALVLATALYTGYFPFAPGTVGSVVGVVVYLALAASGIAWAVPAAIVAVFAVGVWAAGRAEAHFRTTDPGPVVIDEVAGMLVSLAWIDVGYAGLAAGFVLFRIFDIIKPYPAGRLERLPGGWGIMADDVAAGVYANLVLRLLIVAAPGWLA